MSKNLVLAFDTASDHIALGVGTLDGHVIACNDFPARRAANVQLMPSIDALFSSERLEKSAISCVVCGRGPGSFTGVRIAIATAKGIAYGLGVPLYGISTLDAVAWGAWLSGTRGALGVVADAMRGELYPARYDLSDKEACDKGTGTGQQGDKKGTALWGRTGDGTNGQGTNGQGTVLCP